MLFRTNKNTNERNKKMKAKKLDKPRYVCSEWEEGATIALAPHGKGNRIARKVVTYGISRMAITATMYNSMCKALAAGREWRISHKGCDLIRLFPISKKDCRQISVAAQVMKDFQDVPYSGLVTKCVTELGSRAYTDEEVAKLLDNEIAPREHVTPETTVRCPNCGTEFKVGKSLA